MATNSKSKNKIGAVMLCTFLMLLLAAAATMAAKKIWNNMHYVITDEELSNPSIITTNEYTIERLYHKFYLLYQECMLQREADMQESAGSIFIESEGNTETELAKNYVEGILSEWKANEYDLDYYYTDGERTKREALMDLEKLLSEENSAYLESANSLYQFCVILSIEEDGSFLVQIPCSAYPEMAGKIARRFYEMHVYDSLEKQVLRYLDAEGQVKFRTIQPFKVVLAIQRDVLGPYTYHYMIGNDVVDVWSGGTILFWTLGVIMLLLVLILRRRRGSAEPVHVRFARRGRCYFAEAAVLVLAGTVFCVCESFIIEITAFRFLTGYFRHDIGIWGSVFIQALVTELGFFASFWYLRPLFSLGPKEYLRQYSLICLFGRRCKKRWQQFVAAIDRIDFGKRSSRLLLKAVTVNFFILLVCVSIWFFGIAGLVVYSILLFCFLKTRYDKAAAGYKEVLREANRIAEGELSEPVNGEFGMFTALGEELGRVKEGFRKAVEKEVRSERMKTELITNVSHDLKTPLTAIMTYVELLKKEDITSAERASYIATLENKSKRLKVLIEDLFEVSRAASNNLTLNVMDIDLVQLVKQVAVEYEDRFAEAGLNLRQLTQPEPLIVQLDGQKTCRILENLFTNICKYAMPGSRVYTEVMEKDGRAEISLKNVSANELTVGADEIVERFVRGDASRNTEGSGLGLAIAKNLTEIQGGTFTVEIDGDLFKAGLSFPLKKETTGTESAPALPPE